MTKPKKWGRHMAEPVGSSDAPGWQVHLDSRITRRKVFAFVVDPTGQVVYRSQFLSDVFDILDDWGVVRYTVHGDYGVYDASSRRIRVKEKG